MKQIIFIFIFLQLVFSANAQIPKIISQSGHTNLINDIVVSPNGELLATAGIDQMVKVWDLNSGKLLREFQQGDMVYALEFLSDNLLAAGGYGMSSSSLIIWNIETGESNDIHWESPKGTLEMHSDKDSGFLYVGYSTGELAQFDEKDELKQVFLVDSRGNVNSLTTSKKLIAASSYAFGGGVLKVFSKDDTLAIASIQSKNKMSNLAFLSDKEVIFQTQRMFGANPVSVLDIQSREVAVVDTMSTIFCLNQDRSGYYTVMDSALYFKAFSDEEYLHIVDLPKAYYSNMLLTGSNELILASKDILKVNLNDSKVEYEIKQKQWVNAMSFSPLGNRLAVNGAQGEIINWDLSTSYVNIWQAHKDEVVALTFDHEGNYLASASKDSTVIVWNNDGTKKHWWSFGDNAYNALAMNPSADWLAVSCGDTIYNVRVEEGVLDSKGDYSYAYPKQIFYSPNNEDIAILMGSSILVYDVFKEEWNHQTLGTASMEGASFSYDGKYLAVGGYTDTIYVFDTDNLESVLKVPTYYVNSICFSPNSYDLAVGREDGSIMIIEAQTGEWKSTMNGHGNLVNKVTYQSSGDILASSSWDGKIILWNTSDYNKIAELFIFDNGNWAVVDTKGRYDASNAGDIPDLHFVIGLESVRLNQLKERYYEPGLLQKLLGFNEEALRDVEKLGSVRLFPEVKLIIDENVLTVKAKLRDDTFGKVAFYINGVQRVENIQDQFVKINDEYELEINLNDFQSFYDVNSINKVGVVSYNGGNYLSSGLIDIQYQIESSEKMKSFFGELKEQEPRLYAIVVGTSNYAGESLDLKYADDDAEKFANALSQTSKLFFGDENVDVRLLNTKSELKPTKENIENEFKELSLIATSNDILLVYMSGHGIIHVSNNEDHFHYLTMDVSNSNIEDDAIRNSFTISTDNIIDWISLVPVQKQVLILDACSSGGAIEEIVAAKSASGSHLRALERVKDRVGTFILSGSSSDQSSYESPKYRQSLLTYSLLSAMKGGGLREGEFIDVHNLFEYSEREVQRYASTLGAIQKPQMVHPKGGSFDIGRVDSTVIIELAEIRPIFTRTNLQEEEEFDDVLGLSDAFDDELRNIANDEYGPFEFVDSKKIPGTYRIQGRYSLSDTKVVLTVSVKKDKDTVVQFTVEEGVDELSDLVQNALIKIIESID